MRNYKILVAYDGSRYKGWQILKNEENTIQGKLQRVLESIAGEPVEVIGSGRTDAGVHALAQAANFHVDEKKIETKIEGLPGRSFEESLKAKINSFLPEDIAVTEICEVPERFHARYSAVRKTYRYRIHVSEVPNVFERKYVYPYLDAHLDVAAMRRAAALLLGTNDYMSFCGNSHMKKSTVRTITDIDIRELRRPDGSLQEISIDYTGDGFLQNMIRILTGTLIEVGSGRREADSMPELLAAKKRSLAGYTAPPQGLCLVNVEYEV